LPSHFVHSTRHWSICSLCNSTYELTTPPIAVQKCLILSAAHAANQRPKSINFSDLLQQKAVRPLEQCRVCTATGGVRGMYALQACSQFLLLQVARVQHSQRVTRAVRCRITKDNRDVVDLDVNNIHLPVIGTDIHAALSDNTPFLNFKAIAIVSHHGTSFESGHYIACRRQTDDSWLTCNDTAVQTVVDNVSHHKMTRIVVQRASP